MIRILCSVLLFLVVVPAASGEERVPVYLIGIDGLACPFCSYGIEKQLQRLEGVRKLEVDIKQGQLVIRMQLGKTLDQLQIEEAIERAGFSLRSFQQTVDAEAP